MNFFLVLWAVLSIFLLGFWFWSIGILYKQKQTWKNFAKKHSLRYRSNKVFDSPEITGVMGESKVYFFTAEHDQGDGRPPRRLTSIEITLQSALPVSAAVASGGMVRIVEDLNFKGEYRPDMPGWDNSYIVRSRDIPVFKDYLTEARLRSLVKLMGIKNSWIILFFSSGQGLLRLDTPNPLYDPKLLEEYSKKLLEAAKLMELQKGEFKKLELKVGQSAKTKVAAGKVQIDVPLDNPDENFGLMLEDDD